MLQYSGVTAATPNEPEVEEALGIRIGQNWDKVLAAGEQMMSPHEAAVAGDHARARRHGRVQS